VAGYYDGNGHYVRAVTSGQNLFKYNSGSSELEPIKKSEQFAPFENVHTHRRCPGGATQPAADGSNPWVGGASVDSSECNPGDVPPGP
jgi:phospholipid/cholesterol/gamma-HCH transport system substrate-binding protein